MEESVHLYVSVLGGFSVRRKDGDTEYVLTEQDSLSKRLWTFLQYMFVFHQRSIGKDELIDVLWGDAECTNPVNTLKTLLHRARSAIERLGFPDGKDVLLYRRDIYSWAQNIEVELDIERFDALSVFDPAKDMDQALEAIALYQGDVLPNAAGSPWAVSLRTYYHEKYIKLCNTVAILLQGQGRHEETVRICRDAIALEPYDEVSHLTLMKSLVASGAQQAAIKHYTYVSNLLMDQLGVSPSDEMKSFYRELTKVDMGLDMDLYAVRNQLLEERPGEGAFFCEYVTFQDIYRLEARNARRSGLAVQLAILTLLDENGNCLNSKRCSAVQEELRDTIQHCLRQGDTFTRFSAAQYLILLPTASYENGILVLQRILNAYRKTLSGRTTTVNYSQLPVLPTEMERSEESHFFTAKAK